MSSTITGLQGDVACLDVISLVHVADGSQSRCFRLGDKVQHSLAAETQIKQASNFSSFSHAISSILRPYSRHSNDNAKLAAVDKERSLFELNAFDGVSPQMEKVACNNFNRILPDAVLDFLRFNILLRGCQAGGHVGAIQEEQFKPLKRLVVGPDTVAPFNVVIDVACQELRRSFMDVGGDVC